MGVFIGLFLLTHTTVATVEKGKDSQEQTETENQTNEDQLTISEAVTSSGSQINLGFQSVLLQEVELDGEIVDQNSLADRVIPSSFKALKILFRRIISVNAP